jgi:hypothetical protein
MMLEEYRTKTIERLKSCGDTACARHVLSEVDLVLMNSQLTKLTQDKFWETLYEDLDTLAEEAKFMNDRAAGVKLSTVVVAAQARIVRYREKITGEQDT